MSNNCIFCKIIQEKAPASIVYEDKQTISFMSIQPINIGHTLVVPKNHYENIYEIPEEEIAHLYKIVKKITHSIKESMKADGIRIIQNNGRVAGQVIFHMHVHIIPMKDDNQWRHPKNRDPKMLDQDAERIKQSIL